MPASMMANESSVRSAIAGFLSAKRVKLPKLGLSTVPSAVLHRRPCNAPWPSFIPAHARRIVPAFPLPCVNARCMCLQHSSLPRCPCARAPHCTCEYTPLCVLRLVPHGTPIDHSLLFPAFSMCASLRGWGGPLFWPAGLRLWVFRTFYRTKTCFCTLRGPYQHQYSVRI